MTGTTTPTTEDRLDAPVASLSDSPRPSTFHFTSSRSCDVPGRDGDVSGLRGHKGSRHRADRAQAGLPVRSLSSALLSRQLPGAALRT